MHQNSVGNGRASWLSRHAAWIGVLCLGALTACSGDDHPPVIDDGSGGRSSHGGIQGGGTPLEGGAGPDDGSGDIGLNGTYVGVTTDSSGSSRMRWVLKQTNQKVVGTVTGLTPDGTPVFTGNLTGTVSGSRFSFAAKVPAGNISGAPTCSIDFDGTSTFTSTHIRGTYSGVNSCAGPFADGQLDLAKQ